MRKAQIYSVPAASESGYSWKWRECGGSGASAYAFDLYYDCLRDARDQGYEVELTYASGQTAPGGAEFRLRGMAPR